jgi:glycosyltransferase involved in cell wall biosynthesis
MSYGRFTICSDRGGTSEYVGENGLIFDPESNDSINSMVKKLENINRLETAKNARRFSIENFSDKTFVKQYLKIIKNALS